MLQHVLSAIRLISTTVLFIVEDNITGQLLVSIAFALYICVEYLTSPNTTGYIFLTIPFY